MSAVEAFVAFFVLGASIALWILPDDRTFSRDIEAFLHRVRDTYERLRRNP